MRLSSDCTYTLVDHLVAKRKKELDEKEKELAKIVTDFAMNKVPKPVLELFKTHESWVNSANGCYANGEGLNHNYLQFTGERPINSNSSSIIFEPHEAKEIVKMKNECNKMEKDLNKLRQELYAIIYNQLKTDKKTIAEFPEAEEVINEYYNKTSVNLPSLNLDKLKKQLS